MGGVHAAIVFSGEHEDRRIVSLVRDPMVGGITIECPELVGVLNSAEFRDVELAVRITFHSQHIIDADVRNDRLHELRPLGEQCAHEQTTVAPALDREFRRFRVVGPNQKFSASGEIVEHILLVC